MRFLLAITLGAAVWLCPIWWTPTPVVVPLIWGAACLALWLIFDAFINPEVIEAPKLDPLFYVLIASLAGMIAWRSSNLPNTLAAALCLVCICLAAQLSARVSFRGTAKVLAWGWLLAGIINSAIALVQYLGLTAEPLGTAFGFLRQRNQLATLCNIALLALLYLWHTKTHKAYHLAAALSCLLMTAALAATCSRAGALGFVIVSTAVLAYALIKGQRRLAYAVLFALLSYVVFAWLLPSLISTAESVLGRMKGLASTADGTTLIALQDSRRLLWANTLSLIQSQPLLGVGWRELAYSLQTTDFGSMPRFTVQADNAHNLPLHFAVELGTPFAVLWFGLLAWLVTRHKPWVIQAPEQSLAWGALAVISMHSLLEYPLWYAPFQIAVGLSAGLLFIQPTTQQPISAQSAVRLHRRGNVISSQILYGLAGISLLSFCAYAAFDYQRVRQLYLEHSERFRDYQQPAYETASDSWLFAAQIRFAKLTTTPVTADNAKEMRQLALEVLHFSPEPLVFKALLEAEQAQLK